MVEPKQDKASVVLVAGPGGQRESLPYRIELWDAADHDCVERVLARAFNAQLARAIFKAARTEHPDRRITLRRGKRVVADSAE
jgi:hypothetical protein